jgi:hypothetical protein
METDKQVALTLAVVLGALVAGTFAIATWLVVGNRWTAGRELIVMVLPAELSLLATVVAYICVH